MSFPTTAWSTIRHAAGADADALQRFAHRYRPAVREFIRARGFADGDADDLCQEVFVRLLSGQVLGKADPQRGRFRSLMLAVTSHVIGDWLRKRGRAQRLAEAAAASPDVGPACEPAAPDERDRDFDRAWAVHLAAAAMQRLERQGSPYYAVLRDHLAGVPQDRQRLWIARRKLVTLVRAEIAETCGSRAEFEQEVAYLATYLRPAAQKRRNS